MPYQPTPIWHRALQTHVTSDQPGVGKDRPVIFFYIKFLSLF